MKERIKGFWRTLTHNIRYKEGYFKKGMVIISLLIVLDLVMLWIIC